MNPNVTKTAQGTGNRQSAVITQTKADAQRPPILNAENSKQNSQNTRNPTGITLQWEKLNNCFETVNWLCLENAFLKRFFFYLPYLSSIHEKANCIVMFWTVCPHSLESCYFRSVWATCLSHKGKAFRLVPCPGTQLANLPACSPQPPLNAERQAEKL